MRSEAPLYLLQQASLVEHDSHPELYLREVDPMALANVIVDNRDFDTPKLRWRVVGDDQRGLDLG